jgi:hypothetical protein
MLAWVAAVVLWQHLLDGEASAAVRAARENHVRAAERATRSTSEPNG